MNNKTINLVLFSILAIILIIAEFYFLVSTHQKVEKINLQIEDMRTEIKEVRSKVEKNNTRIIKKEQQEEIKEEEQKKKNKENNDQKQKTKNDKEEDLSLSTSEKLVSPDGNKKFFFASENSKISEKEIKSKDKYSNFYFAFNGDTEFMISGEKKNEDSEYITNLSPKIEFSNGGIKDITKYLKNFPKSQGAAKVLSWYDSESLLVGSSYGDAGSTWMNMNTVNVSSGDIEEVLSCFSDVLPSKDSAISYCVHDDVLYLQDCNITKNQGKMEAGCEKAATYEIGRSSVDFESLRTNSKLKEWSTKTQQNAKQLDEIKTKDYLTLFEEADKFNINNAGVKFKIKSIKEDEGSLIWNLNNGELEKVSN